MQSPHVAMVNMTATGTAFVDHRGVLPGAVIFNSTSGLSIDGARRHHLANDPSTTEGLESSKLLGTKLGLQ